MIHRSVPLELRQRLDLLPLRQMVLAAGDVTPAFARQGLLDWLSRPGRYQVFSHGGGGQILAATERALEEARALLRSAYGAAVRFGAATVHSYVDTHDETLMVPVMFLRIDAPRVHGRALHRLLRERAARLQEIDLQDERVVLRAELPLAQSLGLALQVHALAGDDAHFVSWLSRYERARADGDALAPLRR